MYSCYQSNLFLALLSNFSDLPFIGNNILNVSIADIKSHSKQFMADINNVIYIKAFPELCKSLKNFIKIRLIYYFVTAKCLVLFVFIIQVFLHFYHTWIF